MVHQKNKEKSVKTVSELDCHAELKESWIVYKRWMPNGWLKLELASPIKSLPQSWSVMLRRGPPKKNKEKSVKTVSETGLSCWAVRILNCVQEMGAKWLTQIGVGFTHKVSSTVLICDAKTWSTKKTKRRVWKLFRNWTVMLSCRNLELCTRDDKRATHTGVGFTR